MNTGGGKEHICKLCHFEVMCMCECVCVCVHYAHEVFREYRRASNFVSVVVCVFFYSDPEYFVCTFYLIFFFGLSDFDSLFTSCSTSSWFPFNCGAAIEFYFTSVYLKDNGGIERSSLVIYTYDDVTYAWALTNEHHHSSGILYVVKSYM